MLVEKSLTTFRHSFLSPSFNKLVPLVALSVSPLALSKCQPILCTLHISRQKGDGARNLRINQSRLIKRTLSQDTVPHQLDSKASIV